MDKTAAAKAKNEWPWVFGLVSVPHAASFGAFIGRLDSGANLSMAAFGLAIVLFASTLFVFSIYLIVDTQISKRTSTVPSVDHTLDAILMPIGLAMSPFGLIFYGSSNNFAGTMIFTTLTCWAIVTFLSAYILVRNIETDSK